LIASCSTFVGTADSTDSGLAIVQPGGLEAPVVSAAGEAAAEGQEGGVRSEGVSDPEGQRKEGGTEGTSSDGGHPRAEAESEGKLSSVEEATPVVKDSLTAAQGAAKRKVPMLCQVTPLYTI
jgi:hypothetical protein